MNVASILSFLKKNWLIGVLIAAAIWHYVRVNNMKELLDISNSSRTAQITALQSLHAQEITERDEILENHKERIDEINKKYKMAKWALKKERESNIAKLQKMSKEDLIQLIKDTLGFTYVDK